MRKIIISTILIFFSYYSPVLAGPDDDIYTQINKNMDVFGKLYKHLMLNYIDEINGDKLMKAGIDGMLSTLDPYTIFLDESRKDEADLLTTGKYGGIGITIGIKDSIIVITDVLDGYTAQKEGLKKGDNIIEIDGIKITGKTLGEIRSYTRGQPGTAITIKILRGDKEILFNLKREEIQLKNISYTGVLEQGIGYIKLDRFNKYAENEMIESLNEIKSKGQLNGIILDLRDNPGGLLDAAIGILEKFTEKGSLLLTTRGRKKDSEIKYFSKEDPSIPLDLPIVILINEKTASASEVLAGALQDLDRAVIVGTKSFGKGLVQVFEDLSFGNQLKITNQKYFTPSGRWIQSKNYFKENKSGVFKPNPYFSQNEFKTLKGRKVYAEGGITPDKTVDVINDNELLEALNAEDMYYKFAASYVENKTYSENFEVDEKLINDFYVFITESELNYKTKAEKKLEELKSDLEKKNYSEKTLNYISILEQQLKEDKYRDFENSKNVIARMLGIEILKKFNRPETIIKESVLKYDEQLQQALAIIRDKEYYNSFLQP